MALALQRRANVRLPPEVNRILYIRNLPYKISAEEMYDIFGKYGAIRQIRVSNKAFKGMDIEKKQEELDSLKKKYGISSDDLRK
ncbi:unnamed protein product [Leptidea sinapis]|uniref:RRM domain-containing protein n=1 Tax=Leptidea sinapis TaxID=189913 RepID=A0A5E4PQW9_9NEOP|nr:unnamed protein product [Leptidea sinapis]